jgi:hypothetical protein
MEKLKIALIDNLWIFPILLPEVKNKICTKLNIEKSDINNTSITYLTASLYRSNIANCTLPILKNQLGLTPITKDSIYGEYFSIQIKTIFNNAKILNSFQLPNNIEQWLIEFKKHCDKQENLNCLNHFLENAIFLNEVNFRGASHPHFLGTLFLQVRDNDTLFDFMVSLIHESAHQELFLLNFVDRLINSQFDYNLIHAPYQNKERPPIGRLHSLHALYRMIQFIKIIDPKNENLNFYISKFKLNLNSFMPGELTEFGCFLREEIYETYTKKI